MFPPVVAFAAAAFALSAAPSEASCIAALTWHDQVYLQDSQGVGRPGVILTERPRFHRATTP